MRWTVSLAYDNVVQALCSTPHPHTNPWTYASPVDDRTGQRIVAETARRPENRYGNRPTMKDVAARAGVGLKTVSRVVNGEPGVTPDTERRVQEAIDALGFRRNDSARVLRKGRTASIGLVLEDLADPFYGPLSRAVEEVARAHGALLINGSSAEDPDREQELVLALCARRVDGLVVIPAGDDHRYLEPEIEGGRRHRLRGPPGRADRRRRRPLRQLRRRARRRRPSHRARPPPDRLHRRQAPHPHRRRAAARLPRRDGGRRAYRSRTPGCRSAPPTPSGCAGRPRRCSTGPEPVTALFAGNNRVTVTVVRVLAEQPARSPWWASTTSSSPTCSSRASPSSPRTRRTLGRTAADLLFRRLDGTLARPGAHRAPDPADHPGLGRAAAGGLRGACDGVSSMRATAWTTARTALGGPRVWPRRRARIRSATRACGPPRPDSSSETGCCPSTTAPRSRGPRTGPRRRLQCLPRPTAAQDGGVRDHVSRPDGEDTRHGYRCRRLRAREPRGIVSASPFKAPDAVRELFVTWFDARQLAVVDASEGCRCRRRTAMPAARRRLPVSLGSGELAARALYVYVNRHGVLHDGTGVPRRHPASGRCSPNSSAGSRS